ncbi:hypothetical protein ACMYSQ_004828 [Aspergillus niger]
MDWFGSEWATHQAVGWFCVALISSHMGHWPGSFPQRDFPVPNVSTKGVGAATGMIWLANFIIGVVVPEMLLKLGLGTYLFCGLFCVAATVFSFLFVPETTNRSLEQVAAVFGDGFVDEERNLQSRIAREVWHGNSHAEKEARVRAGLPRWLVVGANFAESDSSQRTGHMFTIRGISFILIHATYYSHLLRIRAQYDC